MHEHTYHIQVSTQLGLRRGVLAWDEQAGALQGTLKLLGKTTLFSGQRLSPDCCSFSGQIQTLVSRIPYRAECTLQQNRVQGTFYTDSGDFSFQGDRAPH